MQKYAVIEIKDKPEYRGVSEFLCVKRVQSHPPLGDEL